MRIAVQGELSSLFSFLLFSLFFSSSLVSTTFTIRWSIRTYPESRARLMSFWGQSSASSCNPSLAWVMGSGGKGRIIIKFPFTLESGWYREQACTKFRVFQHRKERKGLQHEFVVLVLLDGSMCRVERMGDPNARFDALSPLGTIAHDTAQSFRPSDIGQACLDSSDLVAEVVLPCDFDIMDVLKICRAIHEGEKTRNYTLQIYNCWFFSLAIQVCLTRFVAHWEDQELLGIWLSQVSKAVGLLTTTDRSPQATIPILDRQIFSQIYSILHPQNDGYGESFVNDVKLQFESRVATGLTIVKQVTYRVNNLLWYSTINSSLNDFIEEGSHNAIMHTLRKRSISA
ncbi:unnamed protein product [Rhizoctonia solani]|uniref:Uncharacterized protein n=1 Tax=Rhizoctonia solani TaxID=456999 RepID=A0A8H2XNB4_9AGAM|nr:unnamed protein product [Rhizoctonia solani]